MLTDLFQVDGMCFHDNDAVLPDQRRLYLAYEVCFRKLLESTNNSVLNVEN